MSLRGTIETFYLSTLLQLLSNDKKTGTLRLATPDKRRVTIYFQDGTIVYATSSNREERLGYILKSEGIIGSAELTSCLQEGKARKEKLGRILVEQKLISPRDLESYIYRQVEQILYNLFLWHEGDFEYEDSSFELEEQLKTRLDTMELILEASRRVDEISVLRKQLPSDDGILKLTERVTSEQEVKLNPREWPIVSLIDGRRSIHQIIHESGYDEFDVYKILFSLVNSGLIESHDETQKRLIQELEQPATEAASTEPATTEKTGTSAQEKTFDLARALDEDDEMLDLEQPAEEPNTPTIKTQAPPLEPAAAQTKPAPPSPEFSLELEPELTIEEPPVPEPQTTPPDQEPSLELEPEITISQEPSAPEPELTLEEPPAPPQEPSFELEPELTIEEPPVPEPQTNPPDQEPSLELEPEITISQKPSAPEPELTLDEPPASQPQTTPPQEPSLELEPELTIEEPPVPEPQTNPPGQEPSLELEPTAAAPETANGLDIEPPEERLEPVPDLITAAGEKTAEQTPEPHAEKAPEEPTDSPEESAPAASDKTSHVVIGPPPAQIRKKPLTDPAAEPDQQKTAVKKTPPKRTLLLGATAALIITLGLAGFFLKPLLLPPEPPQEATPIKTATPPKPAKKTAKIKPAQQKQTQAPATAQAKKTTQAPTTEKIAPEEPAAKTDHYQDPNAYFSCTLLPGYSLTDNSAGKKTNLTISYHPNISLTIRCETHRSEWDPETEMFNRIMSIRQGNQTSSGLSIEHYGLINLSGTQGYEMVLTGMQNSVAVKTRVYGLFSYNKLVTINLLCKNWRTQHISEQYNKLHKLLQETFLLYPEAL
ncbi:MAG: DUF4388 domain-containing protein [Deltaproteobacteria bacterium]|nr:DUF4388 domain-containing protein [Deltaproteobacteria bacterium]